MRSLLSFLSACVVVGFVTCHCLNAAEEVDPKEVVTSPKDYIGKTVTIKVRFGKVNNVFRGWEDQANLNRKIKFIVSPLAEIACYADKTDENEELISGLKPGQEVTITGHIKKAKMEARVKGERHTVKRTVKGSAVYAFVVSKIESVGEAMGPGGAPGMMMRRMMKR
ncbi:MAG: hypothetical protein NTX71_08225 [Candidatus Aureabacteria bacterium]|nr:hypothetical protein [Candidatus Auribacterota bacterium]